MFKKIILLWSMAGKIEKLENDVRDVKDKVDIMHAWFDNVEKISYEYKKMFGN